MNDFKGGSNKMRKLKESNSQLVVEIQLTQNFIQSIFGVSNFHPYLNCIITNSCELDVIIDRIGLSFCGKTIQSPYSMDKIGSIVFSSSELVVEAGKQLKKSVAVNEIVKIISNQLNERNKICFEVTDNTGEKFYSRNIKYGELVTSIKAERMQHS